jgi:hypothetical protein
LVFADDAGRELMQKIEALVCDGGVKCRHLTPGSRQAIGTLLLVLEVPLQPPQPLQRRAQKLRRGDLFTG